jgi:hypothetical protein
MLRFVIKQKKYINDPLFLITGYFSDRKYNFKVNDIKLFISAINANGRRINSFNVTKFRKIEGYYLRLIDNTNNYLNNIKNHIIKVYTKYIEERESNNSNNSNKNKIKNIVADFDLLEKIFTLNIIKAISNYMMPNNLNTLNNSELTNIINILNQYNLQAVNKIFKNINNSNSVKNINNSNSVKNIKQIY